MLGGPQVVELLPPKEDTPPKQRDLSYLDRLAKPKEVKEPPALPKFKLPVYGKLKQMLPKVREMGLKTKSKISSNTSKSKSKNSKGKSSIQSAQESIVE
jgi:hypothetical protein